MLLILLSLSLQISAQITWNNCEFTSTLAFRCANVTVPLDWISQTEETISVHLTFLPQPQSIGQLWFFGGGPTGGDWFNSVDFIEEFPNYDLYFPEPRG